MNRAATLQLASEAEEALAGYLDAGEEFLVTLDGSKAPAAAQRGGHVVVFGPPSVTYRTGNIVDAEWTVWLVSGPDLEAGWPRLDTLLTALRSPLDLDTAEPDSLTGSTGSTYPAYRAVTRATFTL